MTHLRLVEAASIEQRSVPEWDTLEALVSDVRQIKITGGQIEILRAMSTELRNQGFRLYPGMLDGIVERWEQAPTGGAA